MAFKTFLERAGLWESDEPVADSDAAPPAPVKRPVRSAPDSSVPSLPTSPAPAAPVAQTIEAQLQEAAEPGLSKYMVLDGKYTPTVPDPAQRHGMVMIALETVGVDKAQLVVDLRESQERLQLLRSEADVFRGEEIEARVTVNEQAATTAREKAAALRAEAARLDGEATAAEQSAISERMKIDQEHAHAVGLIEKRLADLARYAQQINPGAR